MIPLVLAAALTLLPGDSFNYDMVTIPGTITRSLTITNDQGGELIQYALFVKHIDHVKFDGECMSACTLFLSVKDKCITEKAKFGFHMPFGMSPEQNQKAADYVMSQYPEWIRRYIQRHGGLTDKLIVIDYKTASKHIKACK